MLLIFKNQPLRSTIMRTALPAMLEMILYMLIGIVDVAVVGRLGAVPLAAVSLGAEIFFEIILFLGAMGIGSAVLTAQARGAGKIHEAEQIAGQTVLLGVLMGSISGILGFFGADFIVGLFKVEPMVHALAVRYVEITFTIAPLAVLYVMLSSLYRGWGRTDIPMYVAVVVNIINCVGCYVLVYGKLGLPALGVAGSALATAIAHMVGCLIIFTILVRGGGGLKLHWETVKRLQRQVLKKIFSLGTPSFMEQFFNNLSIMIAVYLIVFTGTVSYAAHQVGVIVESISYMPGFGIAIAATTLVGQSVGARDKERLLQSTRGTIEFGLLFMGFFALLFALVPFQIAGLFTKDANITAIAGVLIRIAALEQLTIALSMVLGGILKGSGDTRTPMVITVLATWVYRIPMLYLVIVVLEQPIQIAWLVFISDWLLRSIAFYLAYRRRIKADGPFLSAFQ
ncbi:MAG: MATE family efflux transporter [Syntrophomonadaceae bacterium]|nr:MATE family efflux transporter [Syntrophomonadaceae bacterium]